LTTTTLTGEAAPTRRHQRDATVVLLGLLALDLPAAHWEVDANPYQARLSGMASGFEPAARTDVVRAWAAHLGVEPAYRSEGPGASGFFEAIATISDVHIRVWTVLTGGAA